MRATPGMHPLLQAVSAQLVAELAMLVTLQGVLIGKALLSLRCGVRFSPPQPLQMCEGAKLHLCRTMSAQCQPLGLKCYLETSECCV